MTPAISDRQMSDPRFRHLPYLGECLWERELKVKEHVYIVFRNAPTMSFMRNVAGWTDAGGAERIILVDGAMIRPDGEYISVQSSSIGSLETPSNIKTYLRLYPETDVTKIPLTMPEPEDRSHFPDRELMQHM